MVGSSSRVLHHFEIVRIMEDGKPEMKRPFE
jgi:hypothetical protein